MSLPSGTPPLLLTKRLTAFLHANQSAQLPTLLLTTHHGKLLAHASPHPVALLRTHATVAASLLSIHTSSSVAVPTALPGGTRSNDSNEDEADDHGTAQSLPPGANENNDAAPPASDPPPCSVKPVTITVQLSGGTVIVRRLKCGLLFVCVGLPAGDSVSVSAGTGAVENGDLLGGGSSPSEVESVASMGAQTTTSLDSSAATAVVAMRRHAAELSRWLDDKLGLLKVPEEGVGAE